MTECIQHTMELFKTDTCGASAIAGAAFLLGVAATLAVTSVRAKRCAKNCGRPRGSAVRKSEPRFEKRHPAPADGSVEIYVGNLSYEMTEAQLRAEFEAYGTVNSARIITNRYNNKSKGFGFVHMPNRAEADAAVAALNDKELLGRRMKCNEAKNLI